MGECARQTKEYFDSGKVAPAAFVDLVDSFYQLIGEYHRPKHGERSKGAVGNPAVFGIPVFDEGIIPKRIEAILGNICLSHTENFEFILRELPKYENGLAGDICHPRFVASLLRLGDVLDVDNGRFCPVMCQLAGLQPMASRHHEMKHASIQHFMITEACVEIKAECEVDEVIKEEQYGAYFETRRWFDFIEQEFANANRFWRDLTPRGWAISLPQLKICEVSLGKDYRQVEDIKNLELDTGSAFNYLIKPLYKSKWECIRELLQNAVDATLVRIWWCHKDEVDFTKLDPVHKDFKRLCELYPIKVRIVQRPTDGTDDTMVWDISIRDEGTGIAEGDILYILRVGSSKKNERRLEIINRMPDWMRPSGSFGIGLQSVFTLDVPSVTCRSRDLFSSGDSVLTIFSPLRKSGGSYSFKKWKEAPAGFRYGTSCEFSVDLPRIPPTIHGVMHGMHGTSLRNFDPIVNTSLDTEITRLCDAVLEFSKGSSIPLETELELDGEIRLLGKGSRWDTLPEEAFYARNQGIVIRSMEFNSEAMIAPISFKGQKIKEFRTHVPFLFLDVDIVGHDAREILTLNRDDILAGKQRNVENWLFEAVKERVIPDTLSKKVLPLYYAFYWACIILPKGDYAERRKFVNQYGKILEMLDTGFGTLSSLCRCKIIELEEVIKPGESRLIVIKDGKEVHPRSQNLSRIDTFIRYLVLYYLQFKGFTLRQLETRKYQLEKNYTGLAVEAKAAVAGLYRMGFTEKKRIAPNDFGFAFGRRILFPSCKCYGRLGLEKIDFLANRLGSESKVPKIILPFIFDTFSKTIRDDLSEGTLDKLVDFTMPRLLDKKITKDEVRALYVSLIADFNKHMKGQPTWDNAIKNGIRKPVRTAKKTEALVTQRVGRGKKKKP